MIARYAPAASAPDGQETVGSTVVGVHGMFWKSLLSTSAVTASMVMAMAPPAIAQSITSSVRGTVVDASGAPIEGARVTILDTRTNRSIELVSAGGGQFFAPNLEAGGPYLVTISSPSFQTQRVEDVRLNISETANLRFTLEPAAADAGEDDIIVVAARKTVSNLAIGPGSVFALELNEDLPSIARDIRDVIRVDPRVAIDGGNSNSVSCLGANNRFNSFTVDGVRNADNFGLNASGFPNRNEFPLPFDAVRESSVEFAPFDVRYGQFTGCNINIITKSGTNEFHGSGFAVFNSASLTGRTIDGDNVQADDFRNFNWGATFGGPVIKDKLFFFVAYEQTRDSDVVSDGPFDLNFADPQETISSADVLRIQENLEARGFETGGIASNFQETSRRILTRWDWDITDNHRLAFTYQRQRESFIDEEDNGNTRFAFANNFEISGTNSEFYAARLYSDWTDNLSTELIFSRNDITDVQDPIGGGELQSGNPIPRIIVGVGQDLDGDGEIENSEDGTVVFGPGVFRTANDLVTQLDQVKARAIYRLGDHTLTGGYELDQLDVRNLFIVNATGTIVFPNIDALLAGQASPGDEASSTQQPNDADVFGGESAAFFGNGPVNGNPADASAIFTRSIHSIYLQDEWRPIDNLTLLLGLRYDRYAASRGPRENPNFEARYGFPNTQGFGGLDILLPRIGVTYEQPNSLFGSTTYRLGAGVFSGGDPSVWFSNAYSNFGGGIGFGASTEAPCTAEDLNFGATGAITLPNCLVAQQDAEAQLFQGRTDATDPNFELPSVVRFNVGLSHRTDFGGAAGGFFDDWNVQLDFIQSNVRNAVRFIDLSLQQIGTGADGRPIFGNVDPLAPGCNATPIGVGQGFNNVAEACLDSDFAAGNQAILLTNGGSGDVTSFSALFGKTFDYSAPLIRLPGSFRVNLGYAYTDAEDATDGTSAQSTSNFRSTAALDFNNIGVGTSGFERKHNITLATTLSQEFVQGLESTFSMFFQARSGRPLSYVFNDDPFGPESGNDRALLYVPTGPNDPLVRFGEDFDQEGFFEFVQSSGLSQFAGGVAPRNAFRNSWFYDLDFRFAQELPSPTKGLKIKFTTDVENLLNLIDDGRNVLRQQGVREDIVDVSNDVDENGDPVFVFEEFDANAANPFPALDASLWRVQFGLRLQF